MGRETVQKKAEREIPATVIIPNLNGMGYL